MTKHTAAPWLIGENRYDYDLIIRSANNDPVCSVIYAGYSKTEAKANARLIAAAPELLEALNLCTHHGGGWASDDPRSFLPLAVLNKARAAIAKAEEQA